jgi:nucleotide-binding universal stress UspA family protein
MITRGSTGLYAGALADFRSARRRAFLEEILSRLSGKSTELLSFDQVRQQLKVRASQGQQLKEIPLDAIVGSVGRYRDFTRGFLPKGSVSQERWAGVQVAVSGLVGLPPIEAYQIGEAYFVLDGNHRVSVARQLGATYIEAYVTEFQTKVPLSPKDQPDDLILKAEYTGFLERTHLDQLQPEADLSVTTCGQYRVLEEHIEVHRFYLGLDQKRDVSYEEAVVHWYRKVYLPVIQVIREQGVLRDFPDRTETDLYLWASRHRGELIEELGLEIDPTLAAADLAGQAGSGLRRMVARIGERILKAVTPDELGAGPPPGEWREGRVAAHQDERLFPEILVPVSGAETSWDAVAQALEIARREASRLYGLHVVPTEEELESDRVRAIQAEFGRRCEEAGVPGELVLAAGKVPHQICARLRWTDLGVLGLAHPPGPEVLAKLGSGFRTIIRRCARPILALPGSPSSLGRALLAYDGTPKAEEALFVATYLAGRWQIPLTVVTVSDGEHVTAETLARAEAYLAAHGVHATLVQEGGPVAPTILMAAEEQQSDLIIMGGYGRSPMMEVVLGSVVDEVLRSARRPVLLCR